MASTLFSTKQVIYGAAPFTDARIGYNAAAGCLNLLVPGVKVGMQIADGIKGETARGLRFEGTSCFISKAPHVVVEFATEEDATAFKACLAGEPRKILPQQKAAEPAMEEPAKGADAAGEAAPSTPPARAARLAQIEMTPPRTKRARVEAEEIAVEFKK
mmetsp:Transcript_68568/g.153654  ORF Transcript_68568/g.153654 Transcript_68568/m.153654 type:complete len:159 (-) Transcript_68568:28-504(-)